MIVLTEQRWPVVFRKAKVIVPPVPKCGMTSLWLAACEAEQVCPHQELFRTVLPKVRWENVARLRPVYRVVGVVRHPRDRLESCWRGKIQRYSPHFGGLHGLPQDTSFAEFAMWACAHVLLKGWRADGHVRPQAWTLKCGGSEIVCDEIIPLENMTKRLTELLGVVVKQANTSTPVLCEWTPAMRDIHRQVFWEDYGRLGYA